METPSPQGDTKAFQPQTKAFQLQTGVNPNDCLVLLASKTLKPLPCCDACQQRGCEGRKKQIIALPYSLRDMSNVLYLNLESILSLCVAALFLTLGYARWNGGQQCEISDLIMEINATSVYSLSDS